MSGSASKSSTNQDAYAWIGVSGAAWNATTSWQDLASPASAAQFVPGALTPVTIAGASGAAVLLITGGGIAASIGVTGNAGLGGQYSAGSLTVGQRISSLFLDPVYVPGTISLGTGATLAVGNVVDLAGTLALAGASIVATGSIFVGAAPQVSGFVYDNGAFASLSVGAGATLSAAGSLSVDQGVLSVSGAGASANIGGAATLGGGTAFRTAGLLIVSAGGTLSLAGDLNEVFGSVIVSGNQSRLNLAGILLISAPAYSLTAPVGYVSLAAVGGGRVQIGGISVLGVPTNGVLAAARIGVDLTGAIEIGFAGNFTQGAITIDAGRIITASSDTMLAGAIINDGTLVAAGGTLTLTGSLSGSGVVQLGAVGTLVLGGDVAAGGTIAFTGTGGTLVIGHATTVGSLIGGFAAGDSIVLAGTNADSAVYVAGGPASGTLTLSSGTIQLISLVLAGSYATGNFLLAPTLAGATSISLVALPPSGPATPSTTADAFAWTGVSGGSWSSAANWRDNTTGANPAGFIPGAATPVTIAGANGAGVTVVAGGGVSARLSVTGSTSLSGAITTGALTIGARNVPAGGDAAYVPAAVSLTAAVSVSSLVVADGTLALSGAAASLLSTGAISLGSAPLGLGGFFDAGAAGILSVDVGATLTASGSLLVNQGSISVDGSLAVAQIAGSVRLGIAGIDEATGFLVVINGGSVGIAGDLAASLGGAIVSFSSRLSVGGVLTITTPAYHGAAPFGFYSLVASGFGRVQLGGLAIAAAAIGAVPASLAVDLTGAIEIGDLGTASAGSITVDAGRQVTIGDDAVLTGAVVDNGTIQVDAGTLTVAGSLSGSGALRIGKGATVALNGNAGAGLSIDFTDSAASLVIGASFGLADTVAASIGGFQIGDSIVVGGIAADGFTYLPSGADGGIFSLLSGTAVIASLTLTGIYSASDFVLSPTISGATSIGLLPPITSGTGGEPSSNADAYAWIGASGGTWDAAANWQDTTTGASPASFVPGAATPVTIFGPTGGVEAITGGGIASSLALDGNVSLGGFYDVGALLVGSRSALPDSNVAYTTGSLSLAAGSGMAATSVVVASGTLALAGSVLQANSTVTLGYAAQDLGFYFDPGASATARVGAGATLEVGGALAINQGTLTAAGTGALADLGGVTLGELGAFNAAGFLAASGGGSIVVGGDITAIYGGVLVSGAGSHIGVTGMLQAGTPPYFGAAPFGTYTVSAITGGSAQFGAIAIAPGIAGAVPATIAVDATGIIEIGTAGTAAAGTITVDGGRAITAAGDLVLTGAVVDNGTIAQNGGTLTLSGSLSGSGVLRIGAGATLLLNGNATGSGQIVLGGTGATLVIGSRTTTTFNSGIPVVSHTPYLVSERISGLASGDSIALSGATITSASYVATGTNLGTLTLSNGATPVASLILSGNYSSSSFLLGTASGGGTSIGVVAGPAAPAVTLFAPSLIGPGQDIVVGSVAGVSATDILSLMLDGTPPPGVLSLRTDGSIHYLAPPTASAAQALSLSFQIVDQLGRTSAQQAVAITLDPGPLLRPVATVVADGQTVDLSARLLATAQPGVAGDTLSLAGGAVRYTGTGAADSFTYGIANQLGTESSVIVRVLSAAQAAGGIRAAAALAPGAVTTASTIVSDTAAAIAAKLDGLEALARTGRLMAIGLLDGGAPVLAITPAQALADIDALALVATPATIAQRILAADAATAILALGFSQFAVIDSAAGLQAALAGVAALGRQGLLASIRLTDAGTPVLTLPASQLVAGLDGLARLATPVRIVLTDPGTPILVLPSWQFGAAEIDAVLARIATPYTLAAGSPVSAATAAGVAASPAGTTVLDDGRAIGSLFDALQVAASTGRVTAILLRGSGPQLVSLTPSQLTTDSDALAKLAPNRMLSQVITTAQIAGAVLDPRFTSFTVQDSADNLALHLDAIATLARGGELARVTANAPAPVLTITAAQLGRDATVLGLLRAEAPLILRLSDGGTPVVAIQADLLGDPAVRAVLNAVIDPFVLVPAGPVSAAVAAAIGAENTDVLASLATRLDVSDLAANITANLTSLAALLAKGRLGTITLRDSGALPVLDISAADASGFAGVLARIATPYTLAGFFGSAASFVAQIASLETLAASQPSIRFALSGTLPPVLTLTAAQLASNLLALSRIATTFVVALSDAGTPVVALAGWQVENPDTPDVLSHVTTDFRLSVTAPVDVAGALNLAGSAEKLTTPLAVLDDPRAVLADLPALSALAAAGKLASVALLGGPGASLALTAIQATSNAALLGLITTPHTLSLMTGAGTTVVPPGFSSLTVVDSAAAVLANLPALQVLALSGQLAAITLTGATTLILSAATLQADAAALSRIANAQFVLSDPGIPALSFTAAELTSAALRDHVLPRIAGNFTLAVTGVVDAALATALGANPILLATLATPLSIQDSALSVVGALSALKVLEEAGKLSSIRFTDGPVANLGLTTAQAALYSTVLPLIASPYILTAGVQIPVSLSVSAFVAQLAALESQALAGTLGTITLTDAGTPALALSAAQMTGALPLLVQIAGAFTITLTDSGTPALALPGSPAPAIIALLGHVTTPFLLTLAGPVSASAATAIVTSGLVAALSAPLAVTDTGAAVAAALDALEALAQAGWLGAVSTLDNTPTLAVTAFQASADAAALAAIASIFHLSLLTSAAGANDPAASLFASVTIRDSAAGLVAGLAGLLPLWQAGRVAQIQLTDAAPIGLSAAALPAYAAMLSALVGTYSIVLTAPGTPTVTIPADLLASRLVRSAVLNHITGSLSLVVTGAMPAALAASLQTEGGKVLASLATGLTILDTAANIVVQLSVLEALAAAGHLNAIDLTDPDIASLRLTAAQIAAAPHALARIAAPFAPGTATGELFTNAAGLLAQLDILQAQADNGTLAHITLTDTTAPVLTMPASRLTADALALGLVGPAFSVALSDTGPVVLHLAAAQAANAGVVALLGRISGTFTLVIDGPMGAGPAGLLAAALAPGRLAAPIAIVDSAAGLAAGLDGLQVLAGAGQLGPVVVLDAATATLALTPETATADAAVLAAITGPVTLSVITTATAAAGTALSGHFTTVTIRDTAANIVASLPALELLAARGSLAAMQVTDAATLNMSAAQLAASIDLVAHGASGVTLTDGATPTIHLAPAQVTAGALAALNRVTGTFVLVIDGILRAADAARFIAAGGPALANLAAGSLHVDDDVAALTAPMLTALQAMIDKIAGIDLRQDMATLSLTPTQAAGLTAILARITSPFVLSQTVTAGGLSGAVLAAGFRNFTVSDSTANIAAALPRIEALATAGLLGRLLPSDVSVFSLSADITNASLAALAAIDGVPTPIELTDGGTPMVTVPAELLGANLLGHVLGAIASPFEWRVVGRVDMPAATLVGTDKTGLSTNLAGPLDVADGALAIGRGIDALQALAVLGKLGALTVLDGGTIPISLTAAQMTSDAGALSHLSGSYSLAVTGVGAADAATMASRPHVTSVTVSDSAANIMLKLEALQVLAQAGKLDEITFTDAGLPTLVLSIQRQAADAAALAKINVPYNLEVPVGNVTGLDLSVQAYDWHSHALLSGVTLSTLSQGSTASNIAFRSVHLDAAGHVVAELWIDGAAGAQDFGFDMALPDAATASFTRAAALGDDWSVVTNPAAGQFGLQAVSLTGTLTGPVNVGTLTFAVPGTADFALDLTDGIVGTDDATPFTIALNRQATGSDGTVALTSVNFDSYSISGKRSVSDVGHAITAADALAALKIAVGINPNSSPNAAAGIPAPLVSPYQYLAADVNGDGRVTAADALAILRMAVRLPTAIVPHWIFVDEAATTWNPATLKFVATRTNVGMVSAATASVPDKMNISLVGVLVGAVLGRWVPLDANGIALTPDRYVSLPTAYFQSLSASTGTPLDQYGYATAASGTIAAEIAVASGGVLPANPVAIYDSAAAISASLDQLQVLQAAGKLASITFMETTTPIVTLTVQQLALDAGALGRAIGTYRLDVAADDANTATIALAGNALTFIGSPDAIMLAAPATTIHYNLAAGPGSESIVNFRIGTDRLDLDLGALPNSAVLASDVLVAGQHAVLFQAEGNDAHGVVLLGLASGTTAVNLLSQHISFVAGHIYIY
jgi:hypothetical protein